MEYEKDRRPLSFATENPAQFAKFISQNIILRSSKQFYTRLFSSCLIYQSLLAHLAKWYHHFQLAESIERSSVRKDVESCRD
jgi:hypothetical protein